MAGSRVEKLSTIFKRYTGLIKSGGVTEDSRPIWYDVYKHFPPATEPLAIRREPEIKIEPIFYPEDILRARFYQTYGNHSTIHNFVSENSSQSSKVCEKFIEKFLLLAQSKQTENDEIDLNDIKLFQETEAALFQDFGIKLKPIK